MVTIYVESRTVRVRFPVLSFGRWSGALLVRLQDRCEDHLDLLAQAHVARRARREERALRFDLAQQRAEAHQRDAIRALQGRSF
ncbi:MAG: hypothetical protein M3Y20_02085 [Actinomycetota bacterium]|nr:hypothetical protein [Actinomycetota bacterium]